MTPAEILALGPLGVQWNHGALPPEETVPYDHLVILWASDYVGFARPWGDNMNPLRWVDGTMFPRWGTEPPSGWWTVLRQGSEPRPPDVETWSEFLVRST